MVFSVLEQPKDKGDPGFRSLLDTVMHFAGERPAIRKTVFPGASRAAV